MSIKEAVVTIEKEKVLDLDVLAEKCELLRSEGRKIVHCHGVFDLLHIGHIWHLQEAKKWGDVLVVTITPDEFVNKGPHRPAFSHDLRSQQLAALDVVDYVAVNKWPVATGAILTLRSDYYVKGPDYKNAKDDNTGKIVEEEEAVRSIGGKIVFTESNTYSASTLINRHLSKQSQEAQDFLEGLRDKYSISEIVGHVEKLQDISVVVMGETIIDEYQYCEAIGKSSKEPTLVVKLQSRDVFPGGILSIGNHAEGFAGRVSVVSQVGQEARHGDFAKEALHSGIAQRLLVRHSAPTIIKRRYIDNYFFTKLFETYEIDDASMSEDDENLLCESVENEIDKHDLVLVADYGHGFFTDKVVDTVRRGAKFLAVNVQSNAGNLGYQSMIKYKGADFFSVDENEIRIEARDRRGEIRSIISSVASEVETDMLVVTRGKNGSISYTSDDGFTVVPAFAGKVVDRVGAGDAFLTIASMCRFAGVPSDLVGFLGNLSGAQAVATVGNKKSISKLELIRAVESVLK